MASSILFAIAAVVLLSSPVYCQVTDEPDRTVNFSNELFLRPVRDAALSQQSGIGIFRLMIGDDPSLSSVLMNGPETRESVTVDDGQSVIYVGGQVEVTGSPNGGTFLTPSGYQNFFTNSTTGQLIANEFTSNPVSPVVHMGPGVFYYDGQRALFSTNSDFNRAYSTIARQLPSAVNLDFTRVANELVMSIDSVPMSSADGNVMEITGHMAIMVNRGETLLYQDQTLIQRRGSIQLRREEMITSFTELLTDRATRFRDFSPNIFNGPGILRLGMFEGSRVALFSNSDARNQEILSGSVNNQLAFDVQPGMNSAVINDVFANDALAIPPGGPPVRLIELSGADVQSFPTASRVTFDMGQLRVFDSNGRQLGNFRNIVSGFSAFINHEVRNSGAGDSDSFDVPEGGFTLYQNAADPNNPMAGMLMAFGYPSRNPLIRQNIADALAQIRVPPTTTASFSFRTTPDGGAILRANGEDLVSLTDNRPIAVQAGQFINYDGTQLTIYDGGDPSTAISGTPLMINMIAFDDPNFNFFMFNSMFTPSGDIGGPGILYYDDQGRALYTRRQSTINLINGFLASLSSPRITTMRRVVNGTRTNIVDIGNGGRRLVEITSMTTTETPTSRQGVLYTGGTLRTVNGFNVPGNAQIVSTMSQTPGFSRMIHIQLISFWIDSSSFNVREGGAITQPAINSTTRGGGVFYFNPQTGNVLYDLDRGVSSMLITELMNSGINFPTETSDTDELNFFDGRQVFQFMGSSPMFLGGPGTLFTTGNQSYYSQDVDDNQRVIGEISRLIPVDIDGDVMTGEVSVVSGTGTPVYNFTIRTTTDINVGETRTVTYRNGFMTVGSRNISTDEFIVFNGFEVKRFGPMDDVSFPGPGRVTVVPGVGIVYITDSRTTNRIDGFVNRFPVSPPQLVRPDGNIRSPNSTVNGRFGQEVVVYNGSVVFLECEDIRGVPRGAFTFFRNGMPINFTDFTDPAMPQMVEQTISSSTLMIIAMANDTYACRATNDFGRDERFTLLTTLSPDRPPMVINTFKPFDKNFNGRVVTATDPTTETNITIRGTPSANAPMYSENFIFDDVINVACKIDSLPTAFLEFNAQTLPMPGTQVNGTTTDLVPGQSIFTINLTEFFASNPQVGEANILVDCFGAVGNLPSDFNGQIQLNTISYTCEGFDDTGPCSATCGIGLREIFPADCSQRAGGIVTPISVEELPGGLYDIGFDVCFAPSTCPPEVTFEFVNTDMFDECDRPCGTGEQRSIAVCYEVVEGVRTMIVSDENCTAINVTRPSPIRRECNFDRCPRWVPGEYSPCSSTCRGGTQMRNVVCMQQVFMYNDTTGERLCDSVTGDFLMSDIVVPDENCTMLNLVRPPVMRDCNTQVDCPHRWYPEPWQPCEADFCQLRALTCTQFEPTDPRERWEINATNCADLPRPHTVRSCGGGVCSRGIWEITMETPCSVTCGVGVTQRAITCMIGSTEVEPGFCNVRDRPSNKERCILFNCPGRCDFEESICRIYNSFRLCKQEPPGVGACCRSCPLQAAPIVFPPQITQENLVLSLSQVPAEIRMGQDISVCCDANEISEDPNNPVFFLSFFEECNFVVEFAGDIQDFETRAFVGRRLGPGRTILNRICVVVPTAELPLGETIEISLFDSMNMPVGVPQNITVVP